MAKLLAFLFSSSGLTLALCVSAGWTLQGCAPDEPDPDAEVELGVATGRTSATLADGAFALKTDAIAVDEATVTMPRNAETNSVQAGDVIMSGNGQMTNTYLRRVSSVAAEGERVVFTTTNATLADLFSEVDIDQHADFTRGAPDSAALEDVPDATLGTQSSPFGLRPANLAPQDLSVLPGGGTAFGLADGRKGFVAFDGGGRLDMSESYIRVSGGVDFRYQARGVLNPLPEQLRLVLNGGIAVHLGGTLAAEGSVSYRSPTLEYTGNRGIFVGRMLFYAGPVPIPVGIYLKLNGQATVGVGGATELSAGATFTTSLAGGFDYTRAGGLQGVAELRKTVRIRALSGHNAGTVSVTVNPIQAELHFNILNIPDTGPFISLNPYVQVRGTAPARGGQDGTLVNAPRSFSCTGALGAQFRVGGEIEIFGRELGQVSVTLLDYRRDLPICPPGTLTCPTATTN